MFLLSFVLRHGKEMSPGIDPMRFSNRSQNKDDENNTVLHFSTTTIPVIYVANAFGFNEYYTIQYD